MARRAPNVPAQENPFPSVKPTPDAIPHFDLQCCKQIVKLANKVQFVISQKQELLSTTQTPTSVDGFGRSSTVRTGDDIVSDSDHSSYSRRCCQGKVGSRHMVMLSNTEP